jgi:hypothetical protein
MNKCEPILRKFWKHHVLDNHLQLQILYMYPTLREIIEDVNMARLSCFSWVLPFALKAVFRYLF